MSGSSADIEERNSENEVLEYLTEYGYLGGAAHGIALQVISKGKGSLTAKQRDVFRTFVEEEFFDLECTQCGDSIPTCEIIGALENERLCWPCAKRMSNQD